MNVQPNRVFISYSHEDKAWLERLKPRLEDTKGLDTEYFDDQKLLAGDQWLEELQQQMNASTTALLLASSSFFKSKFIKKHELERLRELARQDRARTETSEEASLGYRLIIVPIGGDGAVKVKKELPDIQTVAPLDNPLPEDPQEAEEADVDELVDEIRRAIDPCRVFLEKSFEDTHRSIDLGELITAGLDTRVYRGQERVSPKRAVVVKVIAHGASPKEFQQSLKQMEGLTGVPNAVPVLFTDDNPEYPYYVSPFITRGSLQEHLQDNSREKWDSVRNVMLKIGRALQAARPHGMKDHCIDLRPSNVFIEGGCTIEPFVKLSLRDTAERRDKLRQRLARLRDEDRIEAVTYLLPEQLTSEGDTPAVATSDMYLLGALGCRMLQGEL
ncbi:MAG: TIR domain-containing protein, partial [Pseudomonadota bacterium]